MVQEFSRSPLNGKLFCSSPYLSYTTCCFCNRKKGLSNDSLSSHIKTDSRFRQALQVCAAAKLILTAFVGWSTIGSFSLVFKKASFFGPDQTTGLRQGYEVFSSGKRRFALKHVWLCHILTDAVSHSEEPCLSLFFCRSHHDTIKATSKWALVILKHVERAGIWHKYLERPSVMQTGVCLLFLLWSGGEQERGRPARMCWFLRESRTPRRCSLGSGVRKTHTSLQLRQPQEYLGNQQWSSSQWFMYKNNDVWSRVIFGWGPNSDAIFLCTVI